MNTIDFWDDKVKNLLLGKKIILVRYMTDAELTQTGFNKRGIIIQLDDGTIIWPVKDDEGNDAGAIHYSKKGDDDYVIPNL